jgi:transcriptional regulator with XRE-family HTH domain
MSARRLAAIDAYVGRRIRMRRNALGLSQIALGNAIGVAFQQIQKYEKGTNGVSGQRLLALANALDVPINFFFEAAPGSEQSPQCAMPAFVDEFLADKRGLALARHFVAIADTTARSAILMMAETLAQTGSRLNSKTGGSA